MKIDVMNRERIVTAEMLDRLPPAVQRYLTFTGVVGKPWIDTVHVKYTGQFRMAADRPWMPLQADQVYTTNPPGFQWKAHMTMAGLPLFYGEDTYRDGQGHMFGKLTPLVTLFDARDEKLLQGSMIRYLQEMTWFPIIYLSDYITWQAVDDHAADVTFTDHGKSVSARLYFDDEGRLLTFIAPRYREDHGSYTLDPWVTPVAQYGALAGLNLPVAGWAVWQLRDSDLPYFKVQLTELVYNQPIWAF